MAGRFSVEAVFKAVDRVTAPVTKMQNKIGKFSRSVQRGMRKANKALGSFVGGLKRAGKASLKFAGVGIGLITTGVTLLVREFSKIEDAEAAFTPLLGGAKKAKQAIAELNKTAASTPFQFETLAEVAQTLLPVMDGNIENTIKTVRLLGDTAGGNAQKLQSITRGFTKAMLKGKVDLESLNMIAEAGVPIFGELADTMGVEVNAAFFKMITAGKVTTKQLTQTFEKMTSEGGKFFKGMDIASKTTSGLFSKFKDNVALTAAEIGGALAPTIKGLLKDATAVAVRVRAWAKANKEMIGTKFASFVESIKKAVKGVIAAVQQMNEENSIFERLKTLVIGISDAFVFLAKHGKTIATVIAAVVGLTAVVSVLSGVLTVMGIIAAANPIGLMFLGIAAAIALIVAGIAVVRAFWSDSDKREKQVANPAGILEQTTTTAAADALVPGVGDVFGNAERMFGAQAANDANVVTPQDRVASSIEEKRSTSTAEVTIKAAQGTEAAQTGGKMGSGVLLQSTGSF